VKEDLLEPPSPSVPQSYLDHRMAERIGCRDNDMSDITIEVTRDDRSVRMEQRQQSQHLDLDEHGWNGLGSVEATRARRLG
jgi:hypothetical protein